MFLDLDDSSTIQFPPLVRWGIWYQQWFANLVEGFSFKYPHDVVEDAVSSAFFKVMFGCKGRGSRFSERNLTEKGWYALMWWQTRACLSHAKEHEAIERKHRMAASQECEWCAVCKDGY